MLEKAKQMHDNKEMSLEDRIRLLEGKGPKQDDPNILPADFDGTFKFTNFTDEDFIARWNNVEYTFPALKTTPMIISDASPIEIQNIRKKFARELAEREFYKSGPLKTLEGLTPIGGATSMHSAVTYNPRDLEPFIQRCLAPLPIGQVKARAIPRKDPAIHVNDDGSSSTQVIDKDTSLVGNGTVIA